MNADRLILFLCLLIAAPPPSRANSCDTRFSELGLTASSSVSSVTSLKALLPDYEKYYERNVNAAKSRPAAKALAEKYGLSAVEADAITAYTCGLYAGLNRSLRQGQVLPPYDKFVLILEGALTKLPPSEKVSYRGLFLNKEDAAWISELVPGKEFVEKGFLSTSSLKGHALPKKVSKDKFPNRIGNIRFEVSGKSGRAVKVFSAVPSEAEVLFPAGIRFKVESRTESVKFGLPFIQIRLREIR